MATAPVPLRTTVGNLCLGSAPDSWGVWFPDDPKQIPWERFLDEVQVAGYEWIELGPYGYLPTDPSRLEDELADASTGEPTLRRVQPYACHESPGTSY